MQKKKRMNLLLAENSDADAYLTRLALREALSDCRITTVTDGEKALACIRREGAYAEADRPGLIILELRLPCTSGIDVLTVLKESSLFHEIPIIVFPASLWDRDKEAAYACGAYYYVNKPWDVDHYLMIGYAIAELWQRWTLRHAH